MVAGPYELMDLFRLVRFHDGDDQVLIVHLSAARLNQWNTVRVVPSLTVEEAMQEIQEGTSLF